MKSAAKTRKMTSGNIAKHLLVFAIPLFLGSLLQQLYSVVDTMVVGHYLGDNAIAAIGSTASMYSLLINLAIGMNAGFAIIVTQAFGAKNSDKLKKSLAGMTVLNIAICLFLTAVGLLLLDPFHIGNPHAGAAMNSLAGFLSKSKITIIGGNQA